MNISSNISSIKAHQTMMNTSGSDVANVNSDGYIPRDTTISGAEDSVTANIREGGPTGFLHYISQLPGQNQPALSRH